MNNFKTALNYLEGRINLLDTKASIIIAVETLFIGILTFLLEHAELFNSKWNLTFLLFLFLLVSFLISFIIIGKLLWVVRPTRKFFWKKDPSPNSPPNKEKIPSIFWPNMSVSEEPTKDAFKKSWDRIKNSNDSFEEDLCETIFTLHKLIFRKYKHYRCAIWLAKMQALILGIFFVILMSNMK